MDRHLPHDTARNARFFIGVVNAAKMEILSAGQQLFQLAAEVPAAILARTLGVSTGVAVTWQRLSSGDWAAYAADVSRRPRQQPVPSRHETQDPT